MNKRKTARLLFALGAAVALVFASTAAMLAFSVFANGSGVFRKYADSDIPFVYRVNQNTSAEFREHIWRGARQWNEVRSSYWEFREGQPTPTAGRERDGINLVFFDVQGENFAPQTNVIAFSSTFTTTTGGFRAVESDLIWNARDFLPSFTGASDQVDLQSVAAHELGHHLGLGHQGPAGSPPGVGPSIPAAVMTGTVSLGDTTGRHLHIHDLAGISTIYPVWRMRGIVTNATTNAPLADARVSLSGSSAAILGPLENPSNTFQHPGFVQEMVSTDAAGNYAFVALDQSFQVQADAFGFFPQTISINFAAPGGIGQTQTLVRNFALAPTPVVALQGRVADSQTGQGLVCTVRITAIGEHNVPAPILLTTNSNGEFSANLFSDERYDIEVEPPYPYPDLIRRNAVYLATTGTISNFALEPARVLLVDDDEGESFETLYHATLDSLQTTRRTWRVEQAGLPSLSQVALLPTPRILVYFTGAATTTALTDSQRAFLLEYLDTGNSLLLSGQNIAENSVPNDALLSKYLGVRYSARSPRLSVRGFAGDEVGEGFRATLVAGAPQASKDELALTGEGSGAVFRSFYYGANNLADTVRIAAVRVTEVQSGWRAFFAGFGIEGIGDPMQRTEALTRILTFLGHTPATAVAENFSEHAPTSYALAQNYPNPFNPGTAISYRLAARGRVTLRVFDLTGREVATLVDRDHLPGRYQIAWNGTDSRGARVASGVYFYRLETEGFAKTLKMVLAK